MLKISHRWAPFAVSPRIFATKMGSSHGHSWNSVDRFSNRSSDTGVWPSLLSCWKAFGQVLHYLAASCHFSPSCNEHKITYFLFSWKNESEAKNHADFFRDKSAQLRVWRWLILGIGGGRLASVCSPGIVNFPLAANGKSMLPPPPPFPRWDSALGEMPPLTPNFYKSLFQGTSPC